MTFTDEFTEAFASNVDTRKKVPRIVILQDNKLKVGWDVFVMFVLIGVTVVIPYRLAFALED